jgi:integrase
MKGVTSQTRNGITYWYARIRNKKVYCGKDDAGYQAAVLAREEATKEKRLRKLMGLGMGKEVKKIQAVEEGFKTVKDLSNWYMELPSIQKQVRYPAKVDSCVHLLRHLGNKPVGGVETDTLETYRGKRESENAASGTIDLEVSVLRSMYRKAWKSRKIHADSIPGEFPITNEHSPRRPITEDEYTKLLENSSQDFGDVVLAGWESAMRSGEICKVTASQVQLDVRHISGQTIDCIDLGIFDTKNKTRRTVPVSAALKEVLKRRLEGLGPDDLVFTRDGKPFTNVIIANRFKRLCIKAGLPQGDKLKNAKGERIGLVFHCLRYTRTTLWIQAGFSDEIVRRATGHKSLEAFRRYVQPDPTIVMRLVQDGRKTF